MNFNKPYLSGNEINYIKETVEKGHISGNGIYTKRFHNFFTNRYNLNKCLLTTSCTDALEMASLLTSLEPGDEVIMPSFTFVSTANAFVLRGVKIVFCDSRSDHPGMNEDQVESLITSKTKAIVVVHYAGVAVDMGKISNLASQYNLYVIEDAAQAIDSYYINEKNEKLPLGGIGHLGAFSFHETKNIISGEGGLLTINDNQFSERAEILWEKGTNRSAFFIGEVNKYGWVDKGSSFLPSDIIAAFLYAQLENLEDIQETRLNIWNRYYNGLIPMENQGFLRLPYIPEFSTNNAHMFYLVCKSIQERTKLIAFLKQKDIGAVFHYQSLHKSDFYKHKHDGRELTNCDRYSQCLVRLPFYYELTAEQIDYVVKCIKEFYQK